MRPAPATGGRRRPPRQVSHRPGPGRGSLARAHLPAQGEETLPYGVVFASGAMLTGGDVFVNLNNS